VAYQEFLRTNGISEDSVEDAEYNCVLEAQKILGEDLSLLSDSSKSREVYIKIQLFCVSTVEPLRRETSTILKRNEVNE
jgi:hypothetical protein